MAPKDKTTQSVCIVVPVYNSRESLGGIVSKVSSNLAGRVRRWSIVFVDDRSPNKETWPALRELAEQNATIRAVRLLKNQGRAAAVFCGLAHAQAIDPGAIVVVMDDDLQHDPGDIVRMLDALSEDPEADVVIAQYAEKHHGNLARLGSWLKSRIDWYYYRLPPELRLTSFVAISPRVAAALARMNPSFPLFGASLMKVAGRFTGLACTHHPRHDGRPSFTFSRRLALFLRIVFSDTILVLRLFVYLGMATAVVALLGGTAFVLQKLIYGQALAGWTSLMFSVALLGGLNIFLCGLIGINVIRAKENVELTPAWAERETVGLGAAPTPSPRFPVPESAKPGVL